MSRVKLLKCSIILCVFEKKGGNWIMLNVQFTFTFMHLAEAFIQSDLQCIQAIHLYCQF